MCGNHQQNSTTPSIEIATAEVAAPADSCCGGHDAAAPATSAQDDVAECPVMPGTPVVKATAEATGLHRDYEGNRYWLCCAGCGPKWDADPAKYAVV